MPDKNEKQRRAQIMNELRKKAEAEFDNSLPMGREVFKALFDQLDEVLTEEGCDHTNKVSLQFLQKHQVENIDAVFRWLQQHGGYCDCEILHNVEEQFNFPE